MLRLPILRGPLRGSWWLVTRGQPGLVLTGRYEPTHTRAMIERAGPGDAVLDIGAHVGYFTLLFARLVGASGSVWAFEPDPTNFRYLQRHVSVNGLRNVQTRRLAISDEEGTVRFAAGRGSGTGHLSQRGTDEVRSTTIDAFCARSGVSPSLIKMDVEGAELRALQGAIKVLERARPVVLLSTHGTQVHDACEDLLRGAGYRVLRLFESDPRMASELLALPE